VSGWGTLSSGGQLTTKLRKVNVNVMSIPACRSLGYNPSWITGQMLCANVPRGGKDACHGDSGGPLFTAGDGDGRTPGQNNELIGVVSWGNGCGKERYPGVYARVTEVLKWIQTKISGSVTCSRV